MPTANARHAGSAFLSTVLLTILGGFAGAGSALAQTLPAPEFVVLPIRLLDTSGEPDDQSSVHAARLNEMARDLAMQLGAAGRLQVAAISTEALAQACPDSQAGCILAQAKRTGASLVFVGVVHKSSTLIMQMFARVVDTGSGATRITRELNFRGDNDESWQRMTTFLARDIVATLRTEN